MITERINSLQNPRIKNLVRLRDASHRRRQERFLIEGHRELSRALSADWPIESVFFCEDAFTNPDSFDLLEQIESSSIEMVPVSRQPFQKAAFRQNPDGWLAVANAKSTALSNLAPEAAPFYLVLEGLEKPGNLGAIFRSANAAGCDAIILSNPLADPFNPSVIRASQGAFFDQPFCISDNETVQDFLESNEINTVALTPRGQTDFWQIPLRQPVALVLGTEDAGLTQDWLAFPKAIHASIPMRGITDSLNVAATAAVACFETRRQRQVHS